MHITMRRINSGAHGSERSARSGPSGTAIAVAQDCLEETEKAAGGHALALPADVADATQIETAAAVVEQQLGLIDIWVNNAMLSVFSPVKQMTAAEFQRVTEVTYLGYVYGTLAALKYMLPRDRGVIVQASSALAYRRAAGDHERGRYGGVAQRRSRGDGVKCRGGP
jgi:NAD(P)-dependent dehydrogenase (short-subunit alcohol dehydrogenase family)